LHEVRVRDSPSIVPNSLSRDVYLVLDDFGDCCGLAWSETDVADTGRPMLIRNLLEGQYHVGTKRCSDCGADTPFQGIGSCPSRETKHRYRP
jgi:hypothetical protein